MSLAPTEELFDWINKKPCVPQLNITLVNENQIILFRYTFNIDSQPYEILYSVTLFALQQSYSWRDFIAHTLCLIRKRRKFIKELRATGNKGEMTMRCKGDDA